MNFLRAEGEFCLMDGCGWEDECFVRASRKRAAASDIIITNHALFFTGFEPESDRPGILPEFKHVIFDEAHHLEDVIAQAYSLTCDTYVTERLLRRFDGFLDTREFEELDRGTLQNLHAHVNRAFRAAEDFTDAGERIVRRLETREMARYTPRLILVPEILQKKEWHSFVADAASFIAAISDCRRAVELAMSELKQGPALVRLRGFSRLLGNIEEAIRLTADPDLSSYAVWLDVTPSGKGNRFRTNVWPLDIADKFRAVTESLDSYQLTSGTLSALGDKDFFTSRLGLNRTGIEFSHYSAPFDLHDQARIFIPSDLEPPGAPDLRIWDGIRENYVGRFANALLKIILRFGGHTLSLFTSIQDMDDVGEAIRPGLEAAGITCLLQFRDGGKSALIEEFSTDPRTALLGTRSFFEGVDIPNSALKCLVIARLPFPHPDEPMHFSRLRHMANEGIDGFANLSLPQANLSLRQAIGRLIRTPEDKGSVIFLDNRVVTRNYGEALLNGLEIIPVEVGPFEEIIDKAAQFVGL
jgi:ATP-dependent DNA helicase DinG